MMEQASRGKVVESIDRSASFGRREQELDELHKKMSWDEFLVYPRKLGWKYEYNVWSNVCPTESIDYQLLLTLRLWIENPSGGSFAAARTVQVANFHSR